MHGAYGYALPVGRIFGIPVSLHWSLLALVLGLFVHDLARYTASAASLALAVSALVVLSILLHELAHAFTAARFGYRTRSIELHAFGGVAQIVGGTAPAWLSARHDILIALAGPLANFLIFYLLSWLGAAVVPAGYAQLVLVQTARLNLLLGLFNLVPCFPLDGGRALLSALRLKMGPVHGDRLAYTVGLIIAVPGFIWGIVTSQPVVALLFYIAFDACRQHRASIDASFGTGRVVQPFARGDEPAGPGWLDRLRGLFSRSREPRPPKLRVIKGGRFEEPPDHRSGRLN